MKLTFKIALTVAAIAVLTSCGSGDQAESSSKQPNVIDTTEGEAKSDSVAPVFAEPDSVPGAPRAEEDTIK